MGKIFESSGNTETTAILNWRVNQKQNLSCNFAEMGKGFMQAAGMIAKGSLEEKEKWEKKFDVVVFPALFSIIQSCELYFKAINISLEFLILDQDVKQHGQHNIQGLYYEMIANIKKSGEENPNGAIKEFKLIKDFIDEVYTNTNLMDFPRYPVSAKKGSPEYHFYAEAPENVNVNMEELVIFCETAEKIFNRMYWYFADKVEYRKEEARI